MPPTQNLQGPKGQLFAEQKFVADATRFQRSNTHQAAVADAMVADLERRSRQPCPRLV